MKNMWARTGITFSFTDDEYKKIKQLKDDYIDKAVRNAMKDGRYQLDGETYFPDSSEIDENLNYELTCDL